MHTFNPEIDKPKIKRKVTSEDIKAEVSAFIASGGEIKELPKGVQAEPKTRIGQEFILGGKI